MYLPYYCFLDLETTYKTMMKDYAQYKGFMEFPMALKGNNTNVSDTYSINLFKEYNWKNNLRFVRIYFDTPTFDRITKDRSAKFVDMLSAIGGTMGLLTGFSIISGVEIIYFLLRIVTYNKNTRINKM